MIDQDDHMDHFSDNDYFHYLDNITTTLQDVELYNKYVVHETIHLFHVYNISKNPVAMNNLIGHLTREQLKLLLETAERFELYEFCNVILRKLQSNEKNSHYKISY